MLNLRNTICIVENLLKGQELLIKQGEEMELVQRIVKKHHLTIVSRKSNYEGCMLVKLVKMTKENLDIYLNNLHNQKLIICEKMAKFTNIEEKLMYKSIFQGLVRMGLNASRIYEKQENPIQDCLKYTWS